jgi:hypothetical protein
LPPVKRTALATGSMKGPVATILVLYPGYRGTPFTTQPRYSARDTPGLPAATLEGFQYRDCWYPDGQHSIEYPSPGTSHPLKRQHRPLQQWDKSAPSRIDSKNLSGQVKSAPHNTDSKNLLECHPPQREEHSRAKKNCPEALSNRLLV